MLHADSSLDRGLCSSAPAGILLAAGLGSRLGGGKMLLPFRSAPLPAHVLKAVLAAGNLSRLVLVLGRDAEALTRALKQSLPGYPPARLETVVNPHPEEGMSSSLRLGLETLLRGPQGKSIQSVAVFLGDQPLIRPETLRALYAAHSGALAGNPEHPATAPEYQGRRGNPVILSRVLFPRIVRLSGDVGAREILAGIGPDLLRLPVNDPGVIHDVDTPEDYETLQAYP